MSLTFWNCLGNQTVHHLNVLWHITGKQHISTTGRKFPNLNSAAGKAENVFLACAKQLFSPFIYLILFFKPCYGTLAWMWRPTRSETKKLRPLRLRVMDAAYLPAVLASAWRRRRRRTRSVFCWFGSSEKEKRQTTRVGVWIKPQVITTEARTGKGRGLGCTRTPSGNKSNTAEVNTSYEEPRGVYLAAA